MQTPYRRFRAWREKRRQKKTNGLDCLDCGDCGCDLLLLSPLLAPVLLLRVLAGAFGATAVDPYVAAPTGAGARAAARLVRSYQLHVSVPRARPVCRMTPTCSRYGLQALSRHGLARGGLLVLARLRRCGRATDTFDPVPPQP